MAYGDNRDLKQTVKEHTKYHKNTKSAVELLTLMYPDKNLEVLDVGARDGYGVQCLTKYGYNKVLGIELIDEYAKFAQTKNRPVIEDDWMESKIADESFDIIFSRHCIEHCRDTDTFLSQCARVLRHNGILFLVFPREDSERFWKRKFPGLQHMAYFPDKESFRKHVEKSPIEEVVFKVLAHTTILPISNGKSEYLFIGRKP
jgi:SAM-dependent methyltransferase